MNKTIERQIDYILKRLKDSGATADTEWTVNLSVYDDESLKALRPTEVWEGGAEEHRKLMGYASAVIRRQYPKINVNLVEIRLADYQLWLKVNNLEDNAGERAKYIPLKTNGQI